MQNQEQGPGDKLTMRGSFDLLYFLSLCHSTCFSVFLRRGFGCEALGFNGFGAFIMLMLIAGADHTGLMTMYFWAWFLALLCQRMVTIGNKRKGIIEHSRYNGWPRVAMAFPGVKRESTARSVVEPLICLAAGLALGEFSEPAGTFIMAGAFSMTVIETADRHLQRQRAQRMHDAAIEMRNAAAMYRGRDNY